MTDMPPCASSMSDAVEGNEVQAASGTPWTGRSDAVEAALAWARGLSAIDAASLASHKRIRILHASSRRNVLFRLRSLASDARWLRDAVASSPATARLPVFANLRTGAWHAAGLSCGACCFKSSDGHPGQWAFSTSRLNLELAAAAGRARGAIVVDATAAGKRWPDSFVTLAVWAAVVNAILAPGGSVGPPLRDCLPPSVPAAHVAPLEALVARTLKALAPPVRAAILVALGPHVAAPLVPMYACQPSSLPPDCAEEDEDAPWESIWPLLDADGHSPTSYLADGGDGSSCGSCGSDSDGGSSSGCGGDAPSAGTPGSPRCTPGAPTTPLLCVSASRYVQPRFGDAQSSVEGWLYVQGAGDDAEAWAGPLGLTPALFAAHGAELLRCADSDACAALARSLAAADAARRAATPFAWNEALRDAWRTARPVEGSSAPAVFLACAADAPHAAGDAAVEPDADHPGVTVLIDAAGDGVTPAQVGACVTWHRPSNSARCVLQLLVPTSKRAQVRFKEAWVDAILPAVVLAASRAGPADAAAAAAPPQRLFVCFRDAGAAAAAAAIAAAAHLGGSRAALPPGHPLPPVDKALLRSELACAAIASGCTSIDRFLFQELTRFFMPVGP